MQSNVLSPEDLASFKQHGYVRLPKAFARADALAIQNAIWLQMQEQGIKRTDQSTWPAGSWRGVKDHPSLEHGIAAPRLCGAINQLLGSENWRVPNRWGGFAVTFPSGAYQDWEVTDTGWHWDDTLINHFGKRSTALFIFTLYSSIQARGGGTLVVSGSHRLIEKFYNCLSQEDQGLKQKLLKSRFATSHPWLVELTGLSSQSNNRSHWFAEEIAEVDGVSVKVVEVTGEPGDAYLCHPAIYHAASPNHADAPRFMRIKGLIKQPNSL